MKPFLSLLDFDAQEIEALLQLAAQLKREPVNDWLKGKVMGLVFMNSSLRTLASFQTGVAQMGGSTFVIQPGAGSWALETRDGVVMDEDKQEHIREAIPVLAGYADLLGVRKFADGLDIGEDLSDGFIKRVAGLAGDAFVNMESAADHPCQALADWLTLDELEIPRDGKFVLSWAYHPKPLTYAVPRAALTMALKRGMKVTIMNPNGFDLPEPLLAEARTVGQLEVVHDRAAAMDGAHVLYCKSWAAPVAYGNQGLHDHMTEDLRDWCVDEPWFAPARPDAKFMHCLPVRRNVKVSDAVLDGPRSVVQREANNRLHAQKAVVARLMGVAQ
jgi:N-acetylornithine carbamoyltransferase